MNNSNFTIKGLKTWASREGGGYQFNLYLDGKKFAWVHDDGNGGETDVTCFDEQSSEKVDCISTWDDKTIFQASPNYALLHNYVRSLPKWKGFDGKEEYTMTMGIWIGELLQAYEMEKKLAKAKKKGITFKLLTDGEGVFRTLNVLDLEKAKQYLDSKFPNQYQLI